MIHGLSVVPCFPKTKKERLSHDVFQSRQLLCGIVARSWEGQETGHPWADLPLSLRLTLSI